MLIYLYRLSKIENRNKLIISTSLLAAVTMVAGSLHIPSPLGIPMHLFIIPLVAILLGPLSGATVAVLVLIVQAFLLGMGGITALGANALTLGLPVTLATYYSYKLLLDIDFRLSVFSATFIGAIMVTVTQSVILLIAGVWTLEVILATLVPFYLFIGVIEGVANVAVLSFLARVQPEFLSIEKV